MSASFDNLPISGRWQTLGRLLLLISIFYGLSVYAAGEEPIAGADSRTLCRSIRNLGKVDPILLSDTEKLPEIMDQLLQNGDLVLAQGAGSVSKLSRNLVDLWNRH